MLMTTCLDMSVLTIVKAAMNGGMPSIVYVVYHNILGTALLLPFYVVHICRSASRPHLTFHILLRFFILGLLGISLPQVLFYVGVGYSSPTMAGALSNLTPAVTFMIAVLFRMEKIDIRSSSSIAKMLGTVIAISGAMLFTFYRGPEIFVTIPSPDSQTHLHSNSEPSNWVFGGLVICIGGVLSCLWSVLQALTGGDDAYFVAGNKWLGVANGVSQWSFDGTDPGVYAQELMRTCEEIVLDPRMTNPLLNFYVEVLKKQICQVPPVF